MFWTIVGALLFVMFVMFSLPLMLGIAAAIIGGILEFFTRGK